MSHKKNSARDSGKAKVRYRSLSPAEEQAICKRLGILTVESLCGPIDDLPHPQKRKLLKRPLSFSMVVVVITMVMLAGGYANRASRHANGSRKSGRAA